MSSAMGNQVGRARCRVGEHTEGLGWRGTSTGDRKGPGVRSGMMRRGHLSSTMTSISPG